jgi:hypothetical protein
MSLSTISVRLATSASPLGAARRLRREDELALAPDGRRLERAPPAGAGALSTAPGVSVVIVAMVSPFDYRAARLSRTRVE